MKDSLDEVAEKYVENFAMSIKSARQIGFKDGAKWQQERICDSEFLQKLRATKSDAEARRLIRTI